MSVMELAQKLSFWWCYVFFILYAQSTMSVDSVENNVRCSIPVIVAYFLGFDLDLVFPLLVCWLFGSWNGVENACGGGVKVVF